MPPPARSNWQMIKISLYGYLFLLGLTVFRILPKKTLLFGTVLEIFALFVLYRKVIRNQRKVDASTSTSSALQALRTVPDSEVMRVRTSWRNYDPTTPLTVDEIATLQEFLHTPTNMVGPFGHKVDVVLIDSKEVQTGKIGTYGVIRGARWFLCGKFDEAPAATDPTYYYDFGYVFENVILQATRMGLGTCWLGGTFSGKNFNTATGCKGKEVVRMVSPVGHVAGERGGFETFMRAAAGSSHRHPWNTMFYRVEGSALRAIAGPQDAGRFGRTLECVRLAPSASNTQPWALVFHKPLDGPTMVSLWMNERAYTHFRLGENDIGIAMAHFELCAKEAGFRGRFVPASQTPDLNAVLPNARFACVWIENGAA